MLFRAFFDYISMPKYFLHSFYLFISPEIVSILSESVTLPVDENPGE